MAGFRQTLSRQFAKRGAHGAIVVVAREDLDGVLERLEFRLADENADIFAVVAGNLDATFTNRNALVKVLDCLKEL